MTNEETMLDWHDENITIEYEGGKYYLNFWHRDHETGGYDVAHSTEYRSMYEAMAGAMAYVDGNIEEERKQQALWEEYDREQALRIEREEA